MLTDYAKIKSLVNIEPGINKSKNIFFKRGKLVENRNEKKQE